MIKHSALLIVLGLVCSGHSSDVAAQEAGSMDAGMGAVPIGMVHDMGEDMGRNSPFLTLGAIPNQSLYPQYPQYPPGRFPYSRSFGYPPGVPLIVLPMPLSINGMSGFNSRSGFQFPGSYMPQGTPLHRFNGYVVCEPPDLSAGAAAGIRQRVVKTTSTRSFATPNPPQPCPVYIVNGEIQKKKGYTTTTTPTFRNAPP